MTSHALPATAAPGVLLLVEDDPDQAFLVARRLREQLQPHLEIVPLGTAGEATARLAAGDVLCVVLDLSLPDAKGLEAVTLVREADPMVPIVVLTGMDSDELGRQAVQLGAQDYLVKGQHAVDAVSRSVTFALERTKRQAAEQSQALLASRLQLVLEASAEGICLIDRDGRLSFANPAAATLLGCDEAGLTGRTLHDFHLCAAHPCLLGEQLRSGSQVDAGEQRFRAADGSLTVLEVRMRPPHDESTGAGTVINLTDVTDRRQAQDALAERETQLIDAQRLAHLGSWEWDLAIDEVVWSTEMYRITGLSPEQVPADLRAFDVYANLVPAEERQELEGLLHNWSAAREPVVIVHRYARPDGSNRWLQCRASVSESAGTPGTAPALRVVGTVQDITDQKLAEDALAHQALHDTLTGLPNRALLLDRLDRALADRSRGTVAVVFMDLDRFKWVNDSLSHSAGDQLLIDVSRRLSTLLRPSDTLARLGGDEFVLAERAPDLGGAGAGHRRAAVRCQLAAPFHIEGRDLVVTTSMGVAMRPGRRGRRAGVHDPRRRHGHVPRQGERPQPLRDLRRGDAPARVPAAGDAERPPGRAGRATRSSSGSSRSWTCGPAASSAARRWRAGSTRRVGCSPRTRSSRTPRRPARSSAWAGRAAPGLHPGRALEPGAPGTGRSVSR